MDILFWVGCYRSYDDRNIKVASSLIQHPEDQREWTLGSLGYSEWCCGIDLRRMGSEFSFQVNAEKEYRATSHVRFREILTTCPHCFNTLKNEYPQFGGSFDVIHYTTLLEELDPKRRIGMTSGGRTDKNHLPRFLLPRTLQRRL